MQLVMSIGGEDHDLVVDLEDPEATVVDARADLSARAAARRIPAFLDALDLDDVTL